MFLHPEGGDFSIVVRLSYAEISRLSIGIFRRGAAQIFGGFSAGINPAPDNSKCPQALWFLVPEGTCYCQWPILIVPKIWDTPFSAGAFQVWDRFDF